VSVLTKIFVGLLVVLSLLLSAATVTFVNVIDDYKRNADAAKMSWEQQRKSLEDQRAAAVAEAGTAREQFDSLNTEAGNLRNRVSSLQQTVAERDAALAKTGGEATRLGVDNSRLVAALSASESMKSALAGQAAELRGLLDKAQDQLGETNVALTGTTNKLDVTEAQRRFLTEQNTELKSTNDRFINELKGRGIDPTRVSAAGITAGAPSALNGIVRETQSIAGVPHATISIGTDDAVRSGMEFNILDGASGEFLGKMTIVHTTANEAVGRIEGRIDSVRAGAQVRTQL
jgi:hypothetical protein